MKHNNHTMMTNYYSPRSTKYAASFIQNWAIIKKNTASLLRRLMPLRCACCIPIMWLTIPPTLATSCTVLLTAFTNGVVSLFVGAFCITMLLTFQWVLLCLFLKEVTRLKHYKPKPPPAKLFTWLQCPTSRYYATYKQITLTIIK